ncbi:MAG: hypothetical protein AMXMBFR64_26330 [Myxococcales bacterium]
MTPEPTLREAMPEDGPAVDAFLASVFGVARPPGTWSWLYRATPAGPGCSVIAEVQGRIVAHAGGLRRALRVGRRVEPCVQSIDAATADGWRHQGLNSRLRALLQRLVGPASVYGFSNPASTPGVLARQGRVALGPLPLLARPLPLARQVHGPAPVAPPSDVTGLLSHDLGWVAVQSDLATLRWRYGRPGAAYGVAEVRGAGRLLAWGVFAVRRVRRLPVALIMDALAPPHLLGQLHEAMLHSAARYGCRAAAALAFRGTPGRRSLARAGFFPVPAWANPEPMTLSVGRWGAACPALVKDPRSWSLSFADHDVP